MSENITNDVILTQSILIRAQVIEEDCYQYNQGNCMMTSQRVYNSQNNSKLI